MGFWSSIVKLLVVAGLIGGLAAIVAELRHDSDPAHADERLYLPDGQFLRHASLGWHAPLADYTWLQATQYYGGYRSAEHDLRYFDGLVRAVIQLDPRIEEVYVFSALVHSFEHDDHERAIDILRQGVLANPESWRLHFEIGFIYYVFLQEYGLAQRWFAAAAELPGASDFCMRFAAWSAGRAGDVHGARALWENLWQTTESGEMRELAERQLDKLTAELNGALAPGEYGPPVPSHLSRSDHR